MELAGGRGGRRRVGGENGRRILFISERALPSESPPLVTRCVHKRADVRARKKKKGRPVKNTLERKMSNR